MIEKKNGGGGGTVGGAEFQSDEIKGDDGGKLLPNYILSGEGGKVYVIGNLP